MRLTLRPNEKLYLNGAVLRVDRKTTLELLNDAIFLLETHVLQAEDTDTPLKQLYFAAQIMLIDPANADQARHMFLNLHEKLLQTVTDPVILSGLRDCIQLAEEGRIFHILKVIRSLFAQEASVLSGPADEDESCITDTTKRGYVHDDDDTAPR